MTTAEAVKLIHEVVEAEVEVVKQYNTARGVTKTVERREKNAVTAVFKALTGTKPTDAELAEMLSV